MNEQRPTSDTPRISVVVTTYNWPAALDLVLDSLSRQTYSNFEVVVADDGSGQDTTERIERWTERKAFTLKHVWQEDDGFRAAAARNRAVAASDADYILFLDGDCLVRADFLQRHADLATKGWLVAGNRVLLSGDFSKRILAERLQVADWPIHRWIGPRLSGGLNRLSSLLRLPQGSWRDRSPQRWKGAKTCNLAVWRDDFVAVNGLDESYQGWGYEDSDLVIRLIRQGIRRRDGRLATTVLHLWHREHERAGTDENLARLNALQENPSTKAVVGIDRYL